MRHSADFSRVVRRGRRASTQTLAVHALPGETGDTTRVGFVVSRAVGNAVVRNRVKRRLRHAALPQLEALGAMLVVVRAHPTAATADFPRLSADLERCLSKVKDGPA